VDVLQEHVFLGKVLTAILASGVKSDYNQEHNVLHMIKNTMTIIPAEAKEIFR